MPLIERFTPRGNLFAHGSSTFATLVTLFQRMAEVRDAIDEKLWTDARAYTDSQVGAVGSNAMAYAQQETAANAAKITTVEGEVDGHESRISAVETLGGLAPGDVSDATVANLLSNPSSDTRGAAFGAFPGREEVWVSARQFGAVGDGVTDDTVALNAFFDYVTTNKCTGYMPRPNYRVTAAAVLPSRPGWSLRGNGNRGTLITQDTDNIPVIQLGNANSTNLHHFSIEGLWLTYKNHQPAANTNATPLYFYDMAWEFGIDDIGFKRGSYAIRVRAGLGCPWGGNWGCNKGLHFGDDLSLGAMDWAGGINAVPNNTFGRFLVEMGPMAGPVFRIRGYNFTINTIEFIQAAVDCPKLFVFNAGTHVQIGTFKVENSPMTVGKQLIEVGGSSWVDIGHIYWSGGGLGTANLTSGTCYLFAVGAGASPDSRVRVGELDLDLQATSTSPLYVFNAGTADVSFVVDRLRLKSGWKLLNNGANASSANAATVGEWMNGKILPRGDADYTVALRDPNISRFTTAFTAPRTITLPTDGNNLHSGLYYEFVFDGAINGTNTATIKAGTTTLRTVSANKVALRYTWLRNATASAGWVLTSYQTLP